MRSFTRLPPLSLYIHLPWCEKKCPYCDFNSHAMREPIPEMAYIDALLADLALDLPQVWGRKIETVFIGGGTPSLFSVDAITRLLSGVRALTNLPPGAEITLEANPGSAEIEKFTGFHAAGVNRLSIGVQSFSDRCLQSLGRIHDGKLAITAVEAARDAGFSAINIDLMFALPGQTAAEAVTDIRQAIDLQPAHISYYQLTLEPNTLFHHQPPSLPNEDDAFALQQSSQSALAQAGYAQYEISAYAREGQQCAHNLNYWQFGDYLGIGAGAHGKITHPADSSIQRYSKRRQPTEYLAHASSPSRILHQRTIEISETGIEFMMNAMRLIEGVPVRVFTDHTGLPLISIQSALKTARDAGLLLRDPLHLQPTEQGLLFLNDLLSIFMGESTSRSTVIPLHGPA